MRILDKTDIWHNLSVVVCSSPKENLILTRVFSVGRVCVCNRQELQRGLFSLVVIFHFQNKLAIIRSIWSWAYATIRLEQPLLDEMVNNKIKSERSNHRL